MERLSEIIEGVRAGLDSKNAARDRALLASRELTRYCANTIRAAHRAEYEPAAQLLAQARDIVERLRVELKDHPDLYYAGYTQDALKEFAEASITCALITDQPLPTPEQVHVPSPAYLNGMGEAMGELRRYILDLMRHGGNVQRCEDMLRTMDEVYSVLVTLDYPDTLTGGLRRTTDMVRGVLERTRGDLTVAARQESLQQALRDVQQQLHPTGSGAVADPLIVDVEPNG